MGELAIDYESVSLPGDADQTLCIHTAEAGSASETALRLLANWTGPSRVLDQPAESSPTGGTA